MAFSIRIFATFCLVFGSSLWIFLALTRRWTTRRQYTGLLDWAAEQGLKIREARPNKPLALPESIQPLGGTVPFLISDHRKRTTILQLQLSRDQTITKWNVLIRKGKIDRVGVAALRPAHVPNSLIDDYVVRRGLKEYPTLSSGQRFFVYGSNAEAARFAAKLLATLPSDVGVILDGTHTLLDFSTRPFDPIEFERVLDLAAAVNKRAN